MEDNGVVGNVTMALLIGSVKGCNPIFKLGLVGDL